MNQTYICKGVYFTLGIEMFILDTQQLLRGDVVLTAETRMRSKAVRKATKSSFSHAILYLGSSSYIHSDGAGVHSGNTQRLLFAEQSQAQVLRLCNRQDTQITAICMFARGQVGKEYSVPEAVRSKIERNKTSSARSNRQFCSRLVSQAYANAGISIVNNPDYCYPQDIANSPLMMQVNNCVREATTEEIEFANSPSLLDKQTEITNAILKSVRALTGSDIQTFEQISAHLFQNSLHDNEITKIFQESGYLDLWKIDVIKNPWHYNPQLFLELGILPSQKLEFAKVQCDGAIRQLEQFKFMYSQFMHLWQKKQLRYFLINIELYRHLIRLTKDRIAAAEHVLQCLTHHDNRHD